jgi:hypothetical protein
MTPAELAGRIGADVARALAYARRQRRGFRRGSIALRLAVLVLSAASTVILGLQDLDFWASLAFSMVALTTVIGAAESFFNWRARWVVMEEMQANLYRLEADLRHYLAKTAPADVEPAAVDTFHERLQTIWHDVSDAWAESRRTDRP